MATKELNMSWTSKYYISDTCTEEIAREKNLSKKKIYLSITDGLDYVRPFSVDGLDGSLERLRGDRWHVFHGGQLLIQLLNFWHMWVDLSLKSLKKKNIFSNQGICKKQRPFNESYFVSLTVHGKLNVIHYDQAYRGHATRKPVFGVSHQVRLKPGCSASEAS